MNPARVALAVVASLAGTLAFAADWSPVATAGAVWNSNVTNANRAGDVIGALQLHAEGEATVARTQLDRDHAATFGFAASAEAWPRFDGLDRVAFGPRAAWRAKFGLGALAPVLGLEAAVDGVAAQESDRAGWDASLRAMWRQRYEDGGQLSLALDWSRLDARGPVFDRSGAEFAAEYGRDLTESWRWSLGFRSRDGDVLSYATPPRPDLVGLARVRTTVTTFGAPRVAYSISGETFAGSLAVSRELDERSTLTFGYEGRTTRRGGLSYANHLVSAAVTRQF